MYYYVRDNIEVEYNFCRVIEGKYVLKYYTL